MATSGMDGLLKIWDIRTYKPLHAHRLSRAAHSLNISQKGQLAVGFGPHVYVSKLDGNFIEVSTRPVVDDGKFIEISTITKGRFKKFLIDYYLNTGLQGFLVSWKSSESLL